VSAVLFVVSGALRAHTRTKSGEAAAGPAEPGRLPRSSGRPAVDGDDDMAEIEALLRKRGIG
jgi:hypothetical protein